MVSLTIAIAYLAYIYSKKVFVENETISCEMIQDRFAKGVENAFSHRVKCDVSFKITNLTETPVAAEYLIKNVTITHGNRSQTGSANWNLKNTGFVNLKANESKIVSVVVGSDFVLNTVRVDAWGNE